MRFHPSLLLYKLYHDGELVVNHKYASRCYKSRGRIVKPRNVHTFPGLSYQCIKSGYSCEFSVLRGTKRPMVCNPGILADFNAEEGISADRCVIPYAVQKSQTNCSLQIKKRYSVGGENHMQTYVLCDTNFCV